MARESRAPVQKRSNGRRLTQKNGQKKQSEKEHHGDARPSNSWFYQHGCKAVPGGLAIPQVARLETWAAPSADVGRDELQGVARVFRRRSSIGAFRRLLIQPRAQDLLQKPCGNFWKFLTEASEQLRPLSCCLGFLSRSVLESCFTSIPLSVLWFNTFSFVPLFLTDFFGNFFVSPLAGIFLSVGHGSKFKSYPQ